MAKFTPKGNRVLIQPDPEVTETSSGILLHTNTKEKPVTGTIALTKGDLKEGTRVLFSKYGYDEVPLNDKTYYVVSEENILGVFED